MSKAVNFRFPEELIERLKGHSKEFGVSVTGIVLMAVEEHLASGVVNEKKTIEAEFAKILGPEIKKMHNDLVDSHPAVAEPKVVKPEVSTLDLQKVLSKLQGKVSGGGYFRPCTKEGQLNNKGKGK